jgi:hypothetical protein
MVADCASDFFNWVGCPNGLVVCCGLMFRLVRYAMIVGSSRFAGVFGLGMQGTGSVQKCASVARPRLDGVHIPRQQMMDREQGDL